MSFSQTRAARAARAAVLLAPALLLAGCISFGSEPPPTLLTLTSTTAPQANAGASGSTASAIIVGIPEAPAKLDVTRVPVQVTDSQVAYVKEAVWVEKPARLFRRLIAETMRTRSNAVILDVDDPVASGSSTLTGYLREFGYDARTGEAVAVFDAIRTANDGAITTRRFESRVPSVTPEAMPVGAALNTAANQIAVQVADWAV